MKFRDLFNRLKGNPPTFIQISGINKTRRTIMSVGRCLLNQFGDMEVVSVELDTKILPDGRPAFLFTLK